MMLGSLHIVIVCSCFGVNDRTISATIAAGAGDLDEVTAMCRAGGDCGSCRATIEDLIEEQVVVVRSRCTAAA